MGRDSKKSSKWEDIEEEKRNKLIECRSRELELKESSGSNIIIKKFLIGYGLYSIVLLITMKLRKIQLNNYAFIMMVGPIFPYLYLLTRLHGNMEKYKEYFEVRNELNNLIKKSSKSSEYK